MEHKYQIFVSSTFEDLKEEREAASWEILKTGHIPVGMESFSATDDRGWGVIQSTIDLSDYYVLVIAGRYGSIDDATGISWTEMEYDYAHASHVPAFVFLRDLSHISANKLETTEVGRGKHEAFKTKLRKRHLCETWTTLDDLRAKVSTAITKAVANTPTAPRPGWFRGNGSGARPAKHPRMRYYHVHLRVTGSEDECRAGNCVLTFQGSGLVESPEPPARFEDRIRSAARIVSIEMAPPAVILNPGEYKRNQTTLHYGIQAPAGSRELFIKGEVKALTVLENENDVLGLHIPMPAQTVTFVLDMSDCGAVPKKPVFARLMTKDNNGVAVPHPELVHIYKLDRASVWFASCDNVGSESDLELHWGNQF